jgi:hypothetical protein
MEQQQQQQQSRRLPRVRTRSRVFVTVHARACGGGGERGVASKTARGHRIARDGLARHDTHPPTRTFIAVSVSCGFNVKSSRARALQVPRARPRAGALFSESPTPARSSSVTVVLPCAVVRWCVRGAASESEATHAPGHGKACTGSRGN